MVSHVATMIDALKKNRDCNIVELEKELGETRVFGQGLLNQSSWYWPPWPESGGYWISTQA